MSSMEELQNNILILKKQVLQLEENLAEVEEDLAEVEEDLEKSQAINTIPSKNSSSLITKNEQLRYENEQLRVKLRCSTFH